MLPKLRKRCLFFIVAMLMIAMVSYRNQDVNVNKAEAFAGNVEKKDLPSQMMKHAANALKALDDQHAFETTLTSRKSVLDNSFPRNWKPCTLYHLMNQEPLQLTVLGGSTSARPAENCEPSGRYSDILQDNLNNQGGPLQFQIQNMAQGATNSMWSAMSLDELVDPVQTDVLVWEYQTNDHWARGAPQPRSLQFWLARVKALYALVQRPPPPILMLFLWEGYIANHPDPSIDWIGGVQEALAYIDHYRMTEGWNIQVVAVGAAIHNTTAFANNPHLLVDDDHHPNCMSAHLIAQMVQHAIYANMATTACPEDDSTAFTVDEKLIPEDDLADLSDEWVRDILKLLLSKNGRVGSHTSWQPHFHNISNLRISNLHDFAHKDVLQGKAATGRADRKLFYSVPICDNGAMQIALAEPDLEWLGIGGDKLYVLQLSINGVEVGWQSHKDFEKRLEILDIQRWVHIGDFERVVARAATYNLSICQKGQHASGKKGLLSKIVGIMRPARD